MTVDGHGFRVGGLTELRLTTSLYPIKDLVSPRDHVPGETTTQDPWRAHRPEGGGEENRGGVGCDGESLFPDNPVGVESNSRLGRSVTSERTTHCPSVGP